MPTDPIISIAAAARALGINRQTLHRQIKAGQVRRHPDGVRLSEVRADRAANLDPSAAFRHRRERRRKPALPEPPGATSNSARARNLSDVDDTDTDDGPPLSDDAHYLRARAKKEAALAEMRELDLLVRKGELVDASEARDRTFTLFRQERDALLNWPARVSAIIAAELGVDAGVLLVTLEKHVRSHLAARALPADA